MSEHIRFREAGVHADVVGDEALILNFATGRYYTIRGTGAFIVKALTRAPVAFSAIVTAILGKYPELTEARVVQDAGAFMNELQAEKLTENYCYTGPAVEVVFEGNYGFERIEIEARLADILTLDPIHEVSTEGWPKSL